MRNTTNNIVILEERGFTVMIKKLVYVILVCFVLGGCSRINLRETHSQPQNPMVTITLDNEQKILIELFPDKAPNTVNNLISLIEEGYYDGLTFHRIIEDYIVQTGDPLMNNYGSPGYTIQGEFKGNGISNNLKHTKGVVSMARGAKYDSAGSQFFITLQDAQMLNGLYAAFGKVIQGMDVVEKIQDGAAPTIEKVTVDTKMTQYPEPVVIPISSR